MKLAKKVIVAVDFSDSLQELLKPLKNMNFLTECEIQFVHVFPVMAYSFGLTEYPISLPIDEDRKMIEQSGLALLVHITEKILPANFQGKVNHHIFFDIDPKWKFSEYVKEQKADLVIIPTRKKHGFFDSSFAQYVNKHTECNLFLLKH